ncbi:hypothetical protein CGC20_15620 [Leishmania donovani]|uniref:Uncharacterized protein n=1 Tax=Leishmania donovani TaxID=5661 RepID=A0A504XPR8_LEIDO|nr:hypothetical protein CGC20_15620 [Leishmania donovani]
MSCGAAFLVERFTVPRYSPATELAYLKSRLCGASITKDGVLEDRSSDNAFQGFFRTCANKFMLGGDNANGEQHVEAADMANTEAVIMEFLRRGTICAKNLPGRGRGNARRGRDGSRRRDNQTPRYRDGSDAAAESSKDGATDLALEKNGCEPLRARRWRRSRRMPFGGARAERWTLLHGLRPRSALAVLEMEHRAPLRMPISSLLLTRHHGIAGVIEEVDVPGRSATVAAENFSRIATVCAGHLGADVGRADSTARRSRVFLTDVLQHYHVNSSGSQRARCSTDAPRQ